MGDYAFSTELTGRRILALEHRSLVLATEEAARRHAEDSLHRTQVEISDFLEYGHLGLHTVGPDGTILHVNRAQLRLLGYAREEYVGHAVSEFLQDPQPHRHLQTRGDILRDQVVRFRAKDGSFRETLVDSTGIWEGNRFVHTRSIIRDLSERRRVEEDLRRTKERVDFILQALPLVLYTLEATDRFRVVWVSPNMERVSGFPAERWLSDPEFWPSRLHPEDRSRVVEEYGGVLSKGWTSIEYRWQCADGTYRWFLDQAALHSLPGGGTKEVLGAWLDITDQKHAEQSLEESRASLRQAQKMEAIGRLAGGVAHDFNNLLTAILGYSALLLEEVGPDFRYRAELGEVKLAGERAAALTRQLLAFSRRQPTNPKVVDLNQAVQGIENLLRRVIPETIRFELIHEVDLGSVRADPGQVDQVIMNLALNARDAMTDGGTLKISTANGQIDAQFLEHHPGAKPGRFVILAVSDTGIGIPKEMLPHLFEPFFTTKAEGKGTGLGLATVYGITKQAGGFVTVSSTVGRGTTFKVYLPRLDEQAATQHDSQAISIVSGTESVLLVDDDAGVRSLVCQCLKAHGYQVHMAADADEAELLFHEKGRHVDLLLTDMVMPGLSGRELASRLRRKCPDLKVLYMSGYTDDAALIQGHRMAGEKFIAKPFVPQDLLSKVRKALTT